MTGPLEEPAGTRDVEFEHPLTVEEALDVRNQHPGAAFADCLLTARAADLGGHRFLTFDTGAARLPEVELLGRTPALRQ